MRRLATTGLAAGLLLALAPLTTQVAHAAPAAAPSAAPAAVDPSTPDGTYTAVSPARLYDSRTNLKRALKPGEAATVPVLGRAGVPSSGVSAVVVNVTVNAPQRSGYLAAYPSTSSGTGISTVTFAAGDTRASLATVPVGTDGAIKVRNAAGANAGTANAIVDVQGYYSTATATATTAQAGYFSSAGERLLDTREDGGALEPFDIVDVDLKFADTNGGEDQVKAVVLNLTAVKPTAAGYLVAYDGAADEPPATSNVNFARGATTPNNAVVPVRQLDDVDGTRFSSFSIGNGSYSADVNVIADYVGVYIQGDDDALRFQPLTSPVRIVNTSVRTGFSTLGPDQTGTATAPSSVAVPGTTAALVGTLTGVRATAATFLTAWPFGDPQPDISNLNPAKGQTVSNHAVVGLSEDARFNVYNLAGTTNLSYDVSGRFDIPASDQSLSSQRKATSAAQKRLSDVQVTGTDRRQWKP